jgi:hypothetical protein
MRGPSAEDDHHVSPASNKTKATTSMNSIPAAEDPIPTRKCCTLCNLLVRLQYSSVMLIKLISLVVSF